MRSLIAEFKKKTPHRRVCICAAWLVILMSLCSYGAEVFFPAVSPYVRIFLCSTVPLVLILLFYGRVRNLNFPVFYRLKPISPMAVWVWILFGIGANCFATLANAPVVSLLSGLSAFEPAGVAVPDSVGEYLMGIVFTALFPAIFEELFCRGAVLREYERYGTTFSVFAAASVFALLHMSAASFVFTWVLGIVLAVVVLKTDSLYPAVIVHFSANLFSLTRGYLNELMPSGMWPLWEVGQLFLIVACAFGFLCAFGMLILVHGREQHKKRRPDAKFGFSISFVFLIVVYVLNHIRLIFEILK